MKLNSFTLLIMSIMSQFLPPPLQPKKKATFTLSLGFNCDVYLKKCQIIDHKRYTYTCISLYKNFSLYFKLSVKLYPQKIHSPSLASYFNHQDYRHDFDFLFICNTAFFTWICRWYMYGTPPGCDVLFIEINDEIKYNFMNSFFSTMVNYIANSVAQWV